MSRWKSRIVRCTRRNSLPEEFAALFRFVVRFFHFVADENTIFAEPLLTSLIEAYVEERFPDFLVAVPTI